MLRSSFTPSIRFFLRQSTASSRVAIVNRGHVCHLSTETRDTSCPDWLLTLKENLPDSVDVTTNVYECDRHGRGESFHPSDPPKAVLTPESVEDIVGIVNSCRENRIPIVPFGTGTSLEGHVACLQGGISLDMSKFTNIEIDAGDDGIVPDAHATVGAGVTRKTLNEALRHTGMQFVVDPGADASIGGMVACGASGTTATKYGTMRENILGLECVLPDGSVARCGTKALKSSAGYDLTSLMTGSEGTLGIITQVTVKLQPIPSFVLSAVCVFDELHDAAAAVAMLKLCGVDAARCELLDTTSVDAFNQYVASHKDSVGNAEKMDEKPTLFLEFHGGSDAAVQEQVSLAEMICTEEHSGSNFHFTAGEEERNALWSARHNLYYASLALRPGAKGALITDACVPLSKFADIISATVKDVQDLGVIGPCFGHAGDGNFHCILPITEDDSEEYTNRLHQVNDNLIRRSLEAGGTCTGEHGVGYGKVKYLEQQYGPGGVHMMRLVKQGIDPLNIMNPGKIIPQL